MTVAVVLAVGSVAVQRGRDDLRALGVETAPADATMRWKLMAHVLRRPTWWFGFLSMVGAFLFQVAALGQGGLTLVQPLLVSELIFLVVILRIWFGRPLGVREATGVLLTVAGLATPLVISPWLQGPPGAESPAPLGHGSASEDPGEPLPHARRGRLGACGRGGFGSWGGGIRAAVRRIAAVEAVCYRGMSNKDTVIGEPELLCGVAQLLKQPLDSAREALKLAELDLAVLKVGEQRWQAMGPNVMGRVRPGPHRPDGGR